MKKNVLYIVFVFLLISCNQGIIQKPNPFIEEDKMEKILYELTVLNAAKNTNYFVFDSNYIDVNDIIYTQNGIDSTQLAQNIVYYASQPEKYKKILLRIEKRLAKEDSLATAQKRLADSLQMEEKKIKMENTLNLENQ